MKDIAIITNDCINDKTIYTSTIHTCRTLLSNLQFYYDEHTKDYENVKVI